MDIVIRSTEKDDFDAVYPLFEQLWPSKELNRDALKEVFCRGVDSDTDELFCAMLDGEIIGFCAYAVMNNLWQEGRISYIYAMVVDEKLRGKGIGSALIREAIAASNRQGMKRVELDCGFHREMSHRFYEKLGFEKRAFLFSYPL